MPASRASSRVCVSVAALVALAGVTSAQLVQPPPPAAKPATPVKIDELKKQQTPQTDKPASQPAAQPAVQPAVQPATEQTQPVDPASIKDRPNMVFEESSHAFGNIPDVEDAVHVFKFTNKGNQTLKIVDMKATCGCTLPNLEKREYEPGESGEIKVTYNPRNKHGRQNQTITITTNDPAMQRTMLTIQADVQPVVSVDPTIAQAGVVRKTEERKITVTVTFRDPEGAVTDVTSSDPTFVPIKVIKSEKIELDGKPAARATIEATVSDKHPVGEIRASGTIRTTDKNKPLISFQVVGSVQGDVYMQPARVSFGSVRPGDAIKATAKLSHRDNKSFKVVSVTADTPSGQALNVTFTPNDPAKPTEYTVEVTGTAMERTGIVRGDLLIVTDVPMEEKIRLPFFGTIRTSQ